MIPKESIVASLQDVVDSYVETQKGRIGDFGFQDVKEEMFAVLKAFRYVFPWLRWETNEQYNEEFSCWCYDYVVVYIDSDNEFTEEIPEPDDLEVGFNPYLGCYDYDC